jgi:tartrate-resistant acid phosphatase type 5
MAGQLAGQSLAETDPMMSGSRVLALLVAVALLTGCTGEVSRAPEAPWTLGFVAFGDSGYDYDYLRPGKYTPPRENLGHFNALARKAWLRDKRATADFKPPPAYFLAERGSFVEASGLFPTARAMQSLCRERDCQFAVMLGDNIYPDGATLGADGRDDETRFRRLLQEPFSGMGPGLPDYRIYVTLGNHDWNTSRAGARAQVAYLERTPPFYMDGLIYRVKPPAGRGEVELFAIDTTVLLAGSPVRKGALNDDGSERYRDELHEPRDWARPDSARERGMVAWLERSLVESDARWKLVLAHHPIWSTGGTKFEQARALRELLLPALCRHADALMAGHEHTLEIHEESCDSVPGSAGRPPLVQIVSGAAARQRGVNSSFLRYQSSHYPGNRTVWAKGMVWGFAHIALGREQAEVSFFSTPDSGTGEAVPEFSYRFVRRGG